jgi:hypothetical protein
MVIDELIQQVGKPYVRYDELGLASGCMAPVWTLYPDLPRYDWPEDESQLGIIMEEEFGRQLVRIDAADIQVGDILLVHMFFGLLHPGIVIERGKMIHCMKDTGWEIMRFSQVRVKGAYRVCQHQ